jgi:hypothetical protein
MERLQGKEGSNLNPTIKAIMKLVALALLATLAKGCDGKNPNEAIFQSIESAKSGTLTMVKETCASTAAEEAGIRAGTEGLKDSQRMDLAEILEQQCLDEHGVVTP